MSNESEKEKKPTEVNYRTYWNERAKRLVGKTIVASCYMTTEERDRLGLGHWYRSTVKIVFDDGTIMFPSQDDEGNDSGVLYAYNADGSEILMPHIDFTD